MTVETTQQLTRWAEALFVSTLQPSDRPAPEQIRSAVACSLRANGGAAGCAAKMAIEYGEHPYEAVQRMQWALRLLAP